MYSMNLEHPDIVGGIWSNGSFRLKVSSNALMADSSSMNTV